MTALLLTLPGPARPAEVLYVAPIGDDTHDCRSAETPCGSVQVAVDKAAPGDTIVVAVGTYTSTSEAVVSIDRDLVLSGGWNRTFRSQSGLSALDGQGVRTGLAVAGATASVERFAFRNGAAGIGYFAGGVDNTLGTLTLTRCSVENNQQGGIWNDGHLTVTESTITANSNNGGGGGIDHILPSAGSLILNNTTVSGNRTTSEGGGLRIGDGAVSLNNSTITGNVAGFGGGGIANRTRATLELRNTIVAGNSARFGPDCFGLSTAPTVSRGHNLIGDPRQCLFTPAAGDLTGVDPRLGPLVPNGGPTRTHGLEPDSPAVDAGDPNGCVDSDVTLLETDQRGESRHHGRRCDIGAFELHAALCDVAFRHESGSPLVMDFEIFSPEPGHWTVWLVTSRRTLRLWSQRMPGGESPQRVSRPLTGVLLRGRVGVLSTLSTRGGLVCSSLRTAESSAPTTRGLRSRPSGTVRRTPF